MAARALVLFAHGARDARWREPFDRLRTRLAARQPEVDVRLAFLELMTPDLPDAIDALAADGAQDITIVPVFFGQGGHLRRDLPALIERCTQAHPALPIRCAEAVGEDDAVLDAIAAYCTRQLG
ncbi:sirohydrochlorin chelatase [Ralstonia syzygii]|uniref:Sirohydrochlorin cobaltochelatase, Cobalamin (Vitamin B12) biosynthesis anaerobic pathway n=1 Tax=Ralstonia syzygii R24 TaxID=907261 RepID=G3A0N1_9RALS|nr:CbiX/SirB N-terminal domain-containing protein [Ralstonia syzygii]CCA84744.1 sirohydrochlorin cobaltochelatase, Cobalamin (Vitamin B12) biosynthesis anaerobic pathway [Ralstonia syzygii R24]